MSEEISPLEKAHRYRVLAGYATDERGRYHYLAKAHNAKMQFEEGADAKSKIKL
jgi:hypothetical protein